MLSDYRTNNKFGKVKLSILCLVTSYDTDRDVHSLCMLDLLWVFGAKLVKSFKSIVFVDKLFNI